MRNVLKCLSAMVLTVVLVIVAIPGVERLQGVMRVQAATAGVGISVTACDGAKDDGCRVQVNGGPVWASGASDISSVQGNGNVNFNVTVADGYKAEYSVNDGETDIKTGSKNNTSGNFDSIGDNFDIEDGKTYTLSVTFSVADPVNNNTGGNGGINPPQQNNISVTFNVSGTRSDLLGCIKVIGSAEGQETGVSTYGSAVNIFNSDSYTLEFEPAPQAMLNSVSYNGSQIPIQGGKAVLSNFAMQDGEEYAFTVDLAVDNGYSNIFWGYDQAEMDEDNYVDPHTGTIEVVHIERNGQTVFDYNPNSSSDWIWEVDGSNRQIKKYNNNDNSLNVNIQYDENREVILTWYVSCRQGDLITFRFVPEPGFQLAQASINGFPLDPQEEECLFNIEMQGLLHMSGLFVEKDNQTAVDSTTVSYATLSGTGGIDHGTLAASIEDSAAAVPSDTTLKNAMGDAGSFVDSVASVDIGITQIISKGGTASYADDADNYWAHDKTELGEQVELSLAVPNNLEDGQTYSIVREHEGIYEELNAVYNSDLEMLTFTSDLFSQFTIIIVEGESETGVTNSTAAAAHEFNQYKHDMENLLATGSGAVAGSGIVVASSTGTVTAQATTQGPKYKEVIKFFMPTGWAEGFSFNLLVDGKANYNSKSGTMTINIPKYLRKEGRKFMIMAVDKTGQLFVYADIDANADTISVTIPAIEGYAFTVIYSDL